MGLEHAAACLTNACMDSGAPLPAGAMLASRCRRLASALSEELELGGSWTQGSRSNTAATLQQLRAVMPACFHASLTHPIHPSTAALQSSCMPSAQSHGNKEYGTRFLPILPFALLSPTL